MKKTILSLILLAAGCFTASAQEEKTVEVFNPHWYIQAQGGVQHTLGEIDDVVSPNVQIAGGYDFTPVWGLRLGVNAWQSKGGVTVRGDEYKWKWNYVAPTLDVTFNLTNAIWGYNPRRIVDFGLFAGIGANIGFNNDEAADVRAAIYANPSYNVTPDQCAYMSKLWSGSKARLVGQGGANLDFKVSKRVKLGLEVNCNMIGDGYNSKKSTNIDWYFNGLAGVKVALGKVSKKAPAPKPEQVVVERVVTREVEVKNTVHDTIYVDKYFAPEPLRRDIFFTICNSEVSKAEMPKVEDIAGYLNRYPKAKVSITGYADKGTGTPAKNVQYARNRAEIVKKLLVEQFGISADRITIDSKGDTVQPFDINDLNRVSICIAE